MNRGLVITVGTGNDHKDIAHALRYSIKFQKPDCLLFLVSAQSEKETLPLILQEEVIAAIPREVKAIDEIFDVETLCRAYLKIIKEWMQGNRLLSEHIMVDYTSGTKPMSSALLYVSIDMELDSLSYIMGKRDSAGRVISGTERLFNLKPLQLQADKNLRKSKEFFNQYQFAASLDLLKAIPDTLEEDLMNKKRFLLLLSEAYLAWDLFQLDKAFRIFSGKKEFNKIAIEWGIHNQLDVHLEYLHNEINEPYTLHRMADLMNNAQRRIMEKRYDDAIGRIYRAYEFLAQLRLFLEFQKDSSCLKIQDIPTELVPKYEGRGGRVYPGLYGSFELLRVLNDPLGKEYLDAYHQEDSSLRKYLEQRNHSILAHGFQPIKVETSEAMYAQLVTFLNRYYPDWERLAKQAKFPGIV